MKILVELEFDEKDLGPKWMNPDNFDLLLYGGYTTTKKLLKVISFKEEASQPSVEPDKLRFVVCPNCGTIGKNLKVQHF